MVMMTDTMRAARARYRADLMHDAWVYLRAAQRATNTADKTLMLRCAAHNRRAAMAL